MSPALRVWEQSELVRVLIVMAMFGWRRSEDNTSAIVNCMRHHGFILENRTVPVVLIGTRTNAGGSCRKSGSDNTAAN